MDLEKLTGVVDSLKLEGRLKRPEYVAAVTGTYRRLLDGEIDKDEAEAALRSVFNRDFTRGYLFGDRGKSIIDTISRAREGSRSAGLYLTPKVRL